MRFDTSAQPQAPWIDVTDQVRAMAGQEPQRDLGDESDHADTTPE